MILDTTELRTARLIRKVSQTRLAEKSGIHITMISRIEQGGNATAATMRALTEGLGIVVADPE